MELQRAVEFPPGNNRRAPIKKPLSTCAGAQTVSGIFIGSGGYLPALLRTARQIGEADQREAGSPANNGCPAAQSLRSHQ
jgi:hypothetical protein